MSKMKLKILTILVVCIMPVFSETNKTESDNNDSVTTASNFTLVKDELNNSTDNNKNDTSNRPMSRITEDVQIFIDNHLQKLRNSSSDNNKNDNNHSINVIDGISNNLQVAINNHLQKLQSNSSIPLKKAPTNTKKKKNETKHKIVNKKTSTNLKTKKISSGVTRKPLLKKNDLGKAQSKQPKPKKKQDLMSRILPMMIIPFMLQTAIIPMVLTALKMALLKSAFIGKIAIIIGLINMFRITTNPGGVYTHNINLQHDHPMEKELVKTHYGYNGDEEYGAYVNRRKRNVR